METFLAIPMIFLSEMGAYAWHRWGSHTNVIPMAKRTHDIHHAIVDDKAEGDFMYVILLLFLYFNILLVLYLYTYITALMFFSLYFPVILIFFWNFYVHTAYHIENHWLNRYEWFRNDKRIHMHHHTDPTKNFGIATHYTDLLLDTFSSAFPVNSISNV